MIMPPIKLKTILDPKIVFLIIAMHKSTSTQFVILATCHYLYLHDIECCLQLSQVHEIHARNEVLQRRTHQTDLLNFILMKKIGHWQQGSHTYQAQSFELISGLVVDQQFFFVIVIVVDKLSHFRLQRQVTWELESHLDGQFLVVINDYWSSCTTKQ